MTQPAFASLATFNTFGALLRFLRHRAQLQQRDLAIAVGYSEGQICRLEQNRRLPDMAVLAARFVPALGLEDEPQLAARLLSLAKAARGEGARSQDARGPQGNLPAPLTTLIDRSAEVAAVCGYLQRPDVRLLTLVGPPGIGKTRLSIQAAGLLHEQFADGVFFTSLAPLRDPARVRLAIAQTLKIECADDRVWSEVLHEAFHDARMLLVLDNFEQVLAAAPGLAELLRAVPGLKLLVTSRAALHLSGEHLYAVPPLELPDLAALPPIDVLARYPALQLFTARVQAVNPGFAVTEENARSVVEICKQLDGLPLALELAAARSRFLSPQALLERLRDAAGPRTLDVLVGGPRDLLAHQQTLRSTIDWSYDMLDAHERQTLMRLSAFVGGCTLQAAEAICEDTEGQTDKGIRGQGDKQLLWTHTLSHSDAVEALLDQSLLRQIDGPNGEPRLVMLETIREYARERLLASGQANQIWQRHAAYHLALAESAERELSGEHQERWLQRLGAEYDNFWAALKWYAVSDIGAGLRLATALRQFWHTRGYLGQGRAWLDELLARATQTPIALAVHMRALYAAGFLAYHQGDGASAAALSEQSLALARALDDTRGVAHGLCNLGGVAFIQNEYDRAAALFEEALALYRQLDARAEIALVLKSLGLVAKDRGEYLRATSFLEESLALRRELGDARGVAQSLFNLGVLAYWQGDYARAADLNAQSIAIYRDLGDKMGAAYALETLGMAIHKQGDHQRALLLLDEGLELFREVGDQVGVALLLTGMAGAARARGAAIQSVQLYSEALALACRVGDKRRAAFCLEGLAGTAEPYRAATLFGASEALRETIGAPLPPAEFAGYLRDVAAARQGDPVAFATAWAAGRDMTLEQAVSYAAQTTLYSVSTAAR
jgi:predicted ATPase